MRIRPAAPPDSPATEGALLGQTVCFPGVALNSHDKKPCAPSPWRPVNRIDARRATRLLMGSVITVSAGLEYLVDRPKRKLSQVWTPTQAAAASTPLRLAPLRRLSCVCR